ncbi:MAG: DUF305 domain-containing protein [Nitriliruptorales bacterium]|nr:DUF305 domain-containing protein [Nitriliruptorales bacterium]
MSETIIEPDVAVPRPPRRTPFPAVAIEVGTGALLGVVLVWLIAGAPPTGAPRPAQRSVEVGFARDMSVHHAQAVEMAELVRDRTRDPELRQLAVDIALTQQAQIGQMCGWLDIWGHPPISAGPRMAWMHDPVDGRMPGMATTAEINRLRRLRGDEADALFLRLMIKHHRAGVAMAEAALERTDEPVVRRLAEAVATAQASEQQVLMRMLNDVSPNATSPADDGASHAEENH